MDERVVALLERMQRDMSFRQMAKRAGIASGDTLARVWRREGRLGAESVRLLALCFGVAYGFTEDDLRKWSGLPERKDVTPSSGNVVHRVGESPLIQVGLQRARRELTDAEYEAIERFAATAIDGAVEMVKSGRLGPTRYRSPDQQAPEELGDGRE